MFYMKCRLPRPRVDALCVLKRPPKDEATMLGQHHIARPPGDAAINVSACRQKSLKIIDIIFFLQKGVPDHFDSERKRQNVKAATANGKKLNANCYTCVIVLAAVTKNKNDYKKTTF